MKSSTTWVLGLGGTAALIAALLACSGDKKPPPDGGTSAACTVNAGEFPDPSCDPAIGGSAAGATCSGGGGTCAVDEAKCGATATCKPMASNAGKDVFDLRLRKLNVVAPASLATSFVQQTLLDKGIDLALPVCGEKGDGAFNWLLRIDKKAGTLETGGAPPLDPLTTGYCFYKGSVGGLPVGPVSAKLTFTGDKFDSEKIAALNVPIFVGGKIDNVIVLPIRGASIRAASLSDNNDCIGKYQSASTTEMCLPKDRNSCAIWLPAGSIGGHIRLEDADKVFVPDAQKTLCALLVPGSGDKCARDGSGKITGKGDYCSETDAPGGCQDSYWMAGTFAASAVKTHDGTGVPECQGTGTPDGGTDGAPGDAASDATTD
jgi:hypothetical protein